MSPAQRVLFLVFSALVFIGIFLTGFDQVHWFLYIPAVILAFAGATGICIGLTVLKKIGIPG